jgi:hypothetical protein
MIDSPIKHRLHGGVSDGIFVNIASEKIGKKPQSWKNLLAFCRLLHQIKRYPLVAHRLGPPVQIPPAAGPSLSDGQV